MAYTQSIYKQEGDWSQRKQRRGQMFRDQHGRTYHATIELKSMETSGVIDRQYTAPLVVPQQYLERSPDPERPYDLVVNYIRWEQDLRTERDSWEREGRTMSRTLYGEKYDASSTDFTAQVLDLIGPPPQYVEPVLAARQGNPWVLGFTTVPDRRLTQFFEPPRDAGGRRVNEPDFSGHEPFVPAADAILDAVLAARHDEELADDARDETLAESLEELYDAGAVGAQTAHRHAVRAGGRDDAPSDTPGAIRKRAARLAAREAKDRAAQLSASVR